MSEGFHEILLWNRRISLSVSFSLLLHVICAGFFLKSQSKTIKQDFEPIKIHLYSGETNKKLSENGINASVVKQKNSKQKLGSNSQIKKNMRNKLKQKSVKSEALASFVEDDRELGLENGMQKLEDGLPTSSNDLSAKAMLIISSVGTPTYTDDAIDANLEGKVVVSVYVDERGNATQAKLLKKIGYGMDERILAAAQNARFIPNKDERGIAIAGWTEIVFMLEIP